jgi:uncharacterized membrane protein
MKKYLLAGLIILIPFTLTFFLIVFLIDFFTEPFIEATTHFFEMVQKKRSWMISHESLRIIARISVLIALCIFILFLGFVARWFFFSSLISFTNKLFSKIPIVKSIYKVCKEVVSALFSNGGRTAFKNTTLVSFPSPKSYSVGFVSGEVPAACQKMVKEKLVSVIILTAPHPISGFLMLVPEKDLHKITMTNEEAIKYIVSCGLLIPETPNKP